MQPLAFRVPFGKSTLIPLGCIHYPVGERELLKEWIAAVAAAENGFTILMGDALDQARTHFRQHMRAYLDDENSQEALDAHHRRDVEALADMLRPIRKKIIGAISGNHYWQFIDGTTSDQYLCQLLSIPFLGPMAVVRLDFTDKDGRVCVQKTLVAHHSGGGNGGRTMGGDVNALGRMEATVDADFYLLSHTHQRHAHKKVTLTISSKYTPVLRDRTKVFVRTGALLKGFKEEIIATNKPHFPSYAEKAAYRPTDLGWVEVHIKTTHVGIRPKAGEARRGEYRTDVRLVS
jgi:hypothetical protein